MGTLALVLLVTTVVVLMLLCGAAMAIDRIADRELEKERNDD